MYKIIPYSSTYLQNVKSWLEARSIDVELAYELPEIGYVVLHNENPIACAFLRRVEGNYALLDSLVSKPDASPETRSEAIDLVVTQVIKTAKQLEFKRLIAYTKDNNTLVRSRKHGFEKLDHAVISLDLSR